MSPDEPRSGTQPDDHVEAADSGGQVSEVTHLDEATAGEEIYPDQATAGYPETESGEPDEGTAGPNARPRDDRPGGGPDNDG